MKTQKSQFEAMFILIAIICGMLWIWNGAKLASCDFEPNWRCEAIHGIGVVIPPTAIITVWFEDDGA